MKLLCDFNRRFLVQKISISGTVSLGNQARSDALYILQEFGRMVYPEDSMPLTCPHTSEQSSVEIGYLLEYRVYRGTSLRRNCPPP